MPTNPLKRWSLSCRTTACINLSLSSCIQRKHGTPPKHGICPLSMLQELKMSFQMEDEEVKPEAIMVHVDQSKWVFKVLERGG